MKPWLSGAAGFCTRHHTDEHGPHLRLAVRSSPGSLVQVDAQRLPTSAAGAPVLAGNPAAQDDPPSAPIEVVHLQLHGFDRSQAQVSIREDRVVADAGGIAAATAQVRRLSFRR
jgi:hypothetical protein